MNATTNGVIPGTMGAKLASLGVILLVGTVLLFALNAKYHFLPAKWDLFQKLGLSKSEDGSYWSDPNSVTALSLDSAKLPPNFPTQYGYSIMFDVKIFNTRANFNAGNGGSMPYRHLLHRGSSDLGNAGTPAGCGGGATPGTAGTSKNGLPQYMNPGFIGDPTTNDILVFIDTASGRESARISGLQLATPYRIGLVVYQGFFEVYLGCKLLVTQMLRGVPIAINPSGIYGLAGSYALSAKIQNLRLWSRTLSVQDIVNECGQSFQPFGSPPPCIPLSINIDSPTADSADSAGTAPGTPPSIAEVVKCPTR